MSSEMFLMIFRILSERKTNFHSPTVLVLQNFYFHEQLLLHIAE